MCRNMDSLFPPEQGDRQLTFHLEKMDALLANVHQVLSELHTSLERTRTMEHRIEELETTVARLNSIIMDLRGSSAPRFESGDRLTALEGMVNRLCTMTADQKSALDHLVETQGESIQELKKEIRTRSQEEEGSPIHEIEDLVRRRS